jgi:hypothetical protein
MSLLDIGLRIGGLPQDTIADLDAHLPHIQRLAAALKQAEPIINQLLPIIAKAYPDFVAVTPLALKLITFVKEKENS